MDTTFRYHYGNIFLHKFDPRFKLIIMAVLCIAVSASTRHISTLFIFLSIIIALIIAGRLPLLSALKDIKPFIIFLLFVFIARLLTTKGEPIIEISFISITREGINDGIKIVLRLFTVMLAGYIFIATTKTFEIKAAIEYFLKPVPFVPEKKISTMLGLLIRFIPFIISCVKETDTAQKARLSDNIKNSVYRIKRLVIPVLFRIIDIADNLAAAMEARAYTEERTARKLRAKKSDVAGLFIGSAVCGILIYFDRVLL